MRALLVIASAAAVLAACTSSDPAGRTMGERDATPATQGPTTTPGRDAPPASATASEPPGDAPILAIDMLQGPGVGFALDAVARSLGDRAALRLHEVIVFDTYVIVYAVTGDGVQQLVWRDGRVEPATGPGRPYSTKPFAVADVPALTDLPAAVADAELAMDAEHESATHVMVDRTFSPRGEVEVRVYAGAGYAVFAADGTFLRAMR